LAMKSGIEMMPRSRRAASAPSVTGMFAPWATSFVLRQATLFSRMTSGRAAGIQISAVDVRSYRESYGIADRLVETVSLGLVVFGYAARRAHGMSSSSPPSPRT
jgi:hypothetical protein